MTHTRTLGRAARLSTKIAELQQELTQLIGDAKASAKTKKTKREGPTLVSLITQIFKKARKPMKASDVYNRLVALDAPFASANPKNSVTARLYKTPGVEKVGPGLFALAKK